MSELQTLEPPTEGLETTDTEVVRMKRPEVYYETGRKHYWIQDSRGDWITINEKSLQRQLRACGFSDKRPKDAQNSPLEECLNAIQLKFNIAYAGPLAGYRKGLLEMGGQRILVTSSPKLIEPKERPLPTLSQLLANMFPGDQRLYLFGWLKVAYESLRAGHLRPGQVLVLAGEANSGKSLVQNLITEIFGGRAGKPYGYMSGQTDFNSELFGTEHLMIEDEVPSTDIRARRAFGARIKEFTVNQGKRCHPKNREAFNAKPFWRVTVSLNDEPENLSILPPLDESLADKIILLKVDKAPFPMSTFTEEERDEFWRTLVAELPGFLWFLTKRWQIPEQIRCDRFGIKHFHHPDLLEAINELAPEVRLLALIEEWFKSECTDPKGFEGTAEKLQSQLFNSPFHGFEAKKLLSWSNATATYLGRLRKQYPERVEYQRTGTTRTWRIKPPIPEKTV